MYVWILHFSGISDPGRSGAICFGALRVVVVFVRLHVGRGTRRLGGSWCDGVSEDPDAVEELSGAMASVEGLRAASSAPSDVMQCVSMLLDCVDRCGSAVLRSIWLWRAAR